MTFGHKLRYKRKVTCGEISLKLRQTNWNVARINVNVIVDELPSQITYYTCLTIDIWTRRHRRTSMQFYALRCHLPKVASFQWNWGQKFSTLLGTPLACRKALSESYTTRTQFCAKNVKNDLKPTDFPKPNFYFETEGVWEQHTFFQKRTWRGTHGG